MHQNIFRQLIELYSSPLPSYWVGDLNYNIDEDLILPSLLFI